LERKIGRIGEGNNERYRKSCCERRKEGRKREKKK
jgi:hypothetical protein